MCIISQKLFNLSQKKFNELLKNLKTEKYNRPRIDF